MSELQLSYEQLIEVKNQVVGGTAIRDVLEGNFPMAEIAIIRGYDQLAYDTYIAGAFFDKQIAQDKMAKISLKKIKPDLYHIVTGTISDLEEGKIKDLPRLRPFNECDIRRVYKELEIALEAIDE